MAKRNPNAFIKRQKEIKRQQKAQEKMAKRHGPKASETEDAFSPETGPDQERPEE